MTPDNTLMVRLFRDKSGSTCVNISVSIDPENGDLVWEGYDIGDFVEKYWGDSDYEYWLLIKSTFKQAVLSALIRDREREGKPLEKTTASNDELLLRLISEKYSNDPGAFTKFWNWCKELGIPAEFSSYA